MISTSRLFTSNNPNSGRNHQLKLLLHISIVVLFLSVLSWAVESYLSGFQISGMVEFLSVIEISKLISIAVISLGIFYTILLASGRKTSLKKSFLQQSLFAIILILILYIYGEQDRFLIGDNPIEDLIDFSFILFLVISLWVIASYIFSVFRKQFSSIKKPVFLLMRGITLVVFIIPLDLLFNYLFLDLVYDLPLYEDYWVLEVPFKIMIILLINFLDEVILRNSTTTKKPLTIKVKSGNQHKFIEPDAIAYFLVQNQISFLHTTSGQKFITDLTLTQLEKELDHYHFFRASRQLLVSRKAVEGYRSAEGKKIELSLSGTQDSSQTHYISRLSAPFFRKWISGDMGTIQS